MKFILFIAFITSLSSFAQRSNSIEDGDLFKAMCVSSSKSVEFSKIKSFLRGKGHNITKLMRDSNIRSYHIREIYDAVMLMPKWLRVSNIRLKKQIIYKTDYKLKGVAMFGSSILTINPNKWLKFPSDRRVAIIFHELAHALSDAMSKLDSSLIWRNIDGGWIKNHYHKLEPIDYKAHTSEYSTSDYFEDFAESVSAFRIDPKYLKRISLKKYNFIKDTVFLGQEFLSEDDCNFKIEDSIDLKKLESSLKKELDQGKVLKLTHEGLTQNRRFKIHPKAVERVFFQRAIKFHILNIGDKFKSTQDEYILKNKYRAYYLNIKNFKGLRTNKSNAYINRLKRNKNVVRSL